MRIVVIASGDLDPADPRWLDHADVVIAADGGATSLDRLGRRPDVLVGDLDSTDAELVARLEEAGTRVERHPIDKEASDTELALRAAIASSATEIVVLGAIGGERLDHELANVLLLADPALVGRDIRLVHGRSTLRVVRDGEGRELVGRIGDVVTLLPLGSDVTGVTTDGLRWPLDRATLRMGRSRGLSNEIVVAAASVQVEHGALLVVEITNEGANAP
ncbi:thiamine diphosphokinase [soil metagenome]